MKEVLLRKLSKIVLWGVSPLLIIFAILQIPGVKLWVIETTADIVKKQTGIELKFSGVSGTLPFTLGFKELELLDSDGQWAKISDLNVAWSPLNLIHGRIHIDSMVAEAIALKRTPILPSTPSEPMEFHSLRDLIGQLPSVTVNKLAVPKVMLAKEFIGRAGVFQAQGTVRMGGYGNQEVAIKVVEIGNGGKVDSVVLDLKLEGSSLNLVIDAQERAGGFVSFLSGENLGDINLKVNGSGDIDDFNLKGVISIPKFVLAELDMQTNGRELMAKTQLALTEALPVLGDKFELNLKAKPEGAWLTADKFEVDRVEVKTVDGSVSAQLAIDMDKSSLTGQSLFETGATGVADFLANGRLKNQVKFTYDWFKGAFELDILGDAKGLEIDGLLEDLVGSTAHWKMRVIGNEKGHILVTPISLTTESGSTIQGKATILPKQGQATGKAPFRANIKIMTNKSEWVDDTLSGQGVVNINATGSLDVPQLEVKASLKEPMLRDKPMEQFLIAVTAAPIKGLWGFKLDGLMSDGRAKLKLAGKGRQANDTELVLEQLSLKGPESSVLLKGKITNGQPSGQATVDIKNLTPYEGWAGTEIEGQLNAKVRLESSGKWVLDLKAKGVENTVFAFKEFTGKVQMDAKQTGQAVLSFKKARYAHNTVKTADFKMSLQQGRGSFDAKATPREGKSGPKFDMKGTLDLKQSRFGLTALSLTDKDDQMRLNSPFNLSYKEDIKFDNLSLSFNKSGQVNVTKFSWGKRLSGAVQVNQFPMQFLDLINPAWHFFGKLTANGYLRGSEVQPNIELNYDAKNIRWARSVHSPGANVQGFVRARGERLAFRSHVTGRKFMNLTAEGWVGFKKLEIQDNAPVNFHLHGSGNLEVLNSLSSTGDLMRGQINTNLRVQGKLDDPRLSGSVHIERGYYENADWGTVMKDLRVHLGAAGRRLTLRQVRAVDQQGGVFSASGSLDFKHIKNPDVSVRLDFKPFIVAHNDFLIARAKGFMRFNGQGDDMKIQGNLEFSPTWVDLAHLRASPPPTMKIIEKGSEEAQEIAKGTDPKTKKRIIMPLDLTIKAPGRLYILGYGLQSQWKGKIKVTGGANDPILKGRFDLEKGKFKLLGSALKMTKGRVVFSGESPVDPTFAIKAEKQVSAMTVFMVADGRSSDPQIQFTSSPAVPQDEVLAQLLFGRDVGNLSVGQGLQLAAALASLKGKGGGMLNQLKGSFGLDSVDLGDQGGSGVGSGLSVGKQINDKMRINLSPGISTTGSLQAQVSDNIHVQADIGAQDSAAFGVQYAKKY